MVHSPWSMAGCELPGFITFGTLWMLVDGRLHFVAFVLNFGFPLDFIDLDVWTNQSGKKSCFVQTAMVHGQVAFCRVRCGFGFPSNFIDLDVWTNQSRKRSPFVQTAMDHGPWTMVQSALMKSQSAKTSFPRDCPFTYKY
jgi:hypothetical protein